MPKTMLPLGTVIAENFMAELERSLLPMLSSYMTSWKRYVDDTINYVKTDAIEHVLLLEIRFTGTFYSFTSKKLKKLKNLLL